MDGPAGYNGWDLAEVNEAPGTCAKCKGTGEHRWKWDGRKFLQSGPCYSCGGTGKQTEADIRRNDTYNRHKIIAICRA